MFYKSKPYAGYCWIVLVGVAFSCCGSGEKGEHQFNLWWSFLDLLIDQKNIHPNLLGWRHDDSKVYLNNTPK